MEEVGCWHYWRIGRILVEMSMQPPTQQQIDDIRKKRTEFLGWVWEFICGRGYIDKQKFRIAPQLVEDVVEHYVNDWVILKYRYRIEGRIQLSKIAGLMTASILRYKPIVPIVDEYDKDNKHEQYPNELLAAVHGLAICGEQSLSYCERLASNEWFDRWLNELLFLLKHRNCTPESLIFIYRTLSMLAIENGIKEGSLEG